MTDCMYEEEPKIIGRINRKKSNPAENNKILLPSGSSTVEFKAASIKRPNNKTADTSVIPVKIDKKPEIESTLKLPDKDRIGNQMCLRGVNLSQVLHGLSN